CQQHHTYPYSF
nr:immunoglobulin light chain junction region [Macaca mulatta]MOW72936.1 immunoglobulin light chain junction region [Macaca mulatta]MOW73028.1 immunoglobulin light chain junction region [Macaca mulatta]MOW73076.1 immunoglobulin light chain junction region [Macaca mulatta]MOW73113.1 immunoglobulin light chain junction region [Macaca mulatta]